MQHMWMIADLVREARPEDSPCRQAYKETSPDTADERYDGFSQTDSFFACKYFTGFYPHLRQMFTAIQVAGPRLNPDSIENGFRAIPSIASVNPFVAACFYPQSDYTCVKDAMAQWWDPNGYVDSAPTAGAPGEGPARGCWRTAEEGKRYLKDRWPEGDVLTQKNKVSTDPCNTLDQ